MMTTGMRDDENGENYLTKNKMECHARRMAVEVLKIAAVKQPYRLLIGIEQAVRFLAFRNIETAGQVLHDTRELP